MLAIAFFVANARYSLFEELMLNPDLAGIPPDLGTYRSRSEWASYNLDRDPRKRAYVNRLIAWSAKWRGVLKTLLAGEQASVPADVSATP